MYIAPVQVNGSATVDGPTPPPPSAWPITVESPYEVLNGRMTDPRPNPDVEGVVERPEQPSQCRQGRRGKVNSGQKAGAGRYYRSHVEEPL